MSLSQVSLSPIRFASHVGLAFASTACMCGSFKVWQHSTMSIVGFTPRWLDLDDSGNLQYVEASEDPPWQTPDKDPKKGYSIMLTKVMMFHRDFLHYCSCGANAIRRSVHRIVDLYGNCADIGVNALAALWLETRWDGQKKMGSGVALFVKPLHQLGNFGKGETALHAQSNEQEIRSKCLDAFQKTFEDMKSRGSTDAREMFPTQTTVVSSFQMPGSTVTKLRTVPYTGHRLHLHVDCVEDNETGALRAFNHNGEVAPLPEACKWEPEPAQASARPTMKFKWSTAAHSSAGGG